MGIDKKGKGEESELNYIKRRLSKKKKKFPEQSNTAAAPKRILSPEIAKLTSQINDKLNPTNFSQETHFSKSDPRYGTPQEGTLTATRGRRAHSDICVEVVTTTRPSVCPILLLGRWHVPDHL